MAFKCARWTMANVLPVVFVLWIIFTIWFIHLKLHLLPLLQLFATDRDEARHRRGMVEAVISQTLTILLAICFSRAVLTDPGSVPNRPEWQGDDGARKLGSWSFHKSGSGSKAGTDAMDMKADKLAPVLREAKQTGERRFCKWCDNYKPDRCHHCRVCKSCILRMDHHCPWIANCVGFRNHKYFFLLVFYALMNVMFVVMTMWETLWESIHEEMHPTDRFLVVFGMTLEMIMGILLTLFFGFHVGLMLQATSTIEHCEKQYRLSGTKPPNYDLGIYANIEAVLGPTPLLWLLPLSPPIGEGLIFPVHRHGSKEVCNGGVEGSAECAETTALLAAQDTSVAEAQAPEVTGAKAASA